MSTPAPTPALRRAYRKPRVREYGGLEELTRSAGNMMAMDGGTVTGMKRTGV